MESPRFLVVVGGTGARRGRSAVSVFGDADEARQEFCRALERVGSTAGWVELASVDDEGRLSRLCRSGAHSPALHLATNRSASSGVDPR